MNRRGFLSALAALPAAAVAAIHAPWSVVAPVDTDWDLGVGAIESEPVIVASGWPQAELLRPGDRFTVSGWYAMNPDGAAPMRLQEFVVTADVSSGGGPRG